MTRVAWIGLGAMGERMASRLVQPGYELRIWNRTARRARPLVAAGASAAATPAAAAEGADVVVTMLSNEGALQAVLAGRDGVSAGISPGATLIEMSTVGPAAIAGLPARLPAAVDVLDAPVVGSLAEADGGRLRLLVGGEAPVVARWEGLLSALGSVRHLGPLGTGAAAKLVANSALLGAVALLGEAVALGDGLGLERDATFAALATTPLAQQAERRRAAIESHDHPPRFPLRLARKDAALIVDAAAAASCRLPLATAVREWLTTAEARGLGAADYTALLTHIVASSRSDDE